jgi:hypothetical protein
LEGYNGHFPYPFNTITCKIGRNDIEVKEVKADGTQMRAIFLIAHRSALSFLVAYSFFSGIQVKASMHLTPAPSLSHLAVQLLHRRPMRGPPPGKKFSTRAAGGNKPRKPAAAFLQWHAALVAVDPK